MEPAEKDDITALPVFPLPSTVLFPGTALPLHVFEPRYLQMVRDIQQSDALLGIVMIRELQNEIAGRVPLHDVACAGRIVHSEDLSDGRMNILVQGLHRVRLQEELPDNKGYRRFHAQPIPDPDPSNIERASIELARLQSCVLSLRSSVAQTDQQLVEVLGTTSDPLELADILSAVLVHDPSERQAMLGAEDLKSRLQKLIDIVVDVMVRVGEPPQKARMN